MNSPARARSSALSRVPARPARMPRMSSSADMRGSSPLSRHWFANDSPRL